VVKEKKLMGKKNNEKEEGDKKEEAKNCAATVFIGRGTDGLNDGSQDDNCPDNNAGGNEPSH
jgi:hypothetical protein